MNKYSILILLVASLMLSCNPVKQLTFAPNEPFDENEISKDLRIEFNGVACFYIQYNGNAVLTDPFLSNPGIFKTSMGKLVTDTTLIQKLNPKTSKIKLITIGHSHYDHIMDLPYFSSKSDSNLIITGSTNTALIAQKLNEKKSIVNVSEIKATENKFGTWVYSIDSTVRIMALQSEHLPHICGKHLYKGSLNEEDLLGFPEHSNQFLQDETLAYLIDFLDENIIPVKRVYFASSASSLNSKTFPAALLKEKSVDVAILSIALSQKAESYPIELVHILNPQNIIYCHWENFFRPRNKPLKFVSMTDYDKIKESLDQLNPSIQQHFVKPGNSIVF
jgi:L-ascorbate metabolism protein UlaG (beta-lactamase superfamily)